MIKSCRSVFFHEGGLKELNNLSIVNVVDVGEVVFHSGAFNQIGVSDMFITMKALMTPLITSDRARGYHNDTQMSSFNYKEWRIS